MQNIHQNMNMEFKNLTAEKLLSTFGLYQKTEIAECFATSLGFNGLIFKHFCAKDKTIETFTTHIYPQSLFVQRPISGAGNCNDRSEISMPKPMPQEYVQTYICTCFSCKQQQIFITLRVYPDSKSKTGWYALKVGQYPAVEITPEKEILNFLEEKDKSFYKKALMCLSQGYGIGAFAYFRRVLENQIKKIIQDLIEAEVENYEKIKVIYENFEKSHQMSNLIENVGRFLPASFKLLGDNPLHLLYQQMSGGIHEFEEESCLEKSRNLDIIFKFLIKKINEEKSELKSVRKAMTDLKNL
jgi:hypothetical protein